MNEAQRRQMREQYMRERVQRVDVKAKKGDRYGKEDMLNRPQHQTNCPNFKECPIDYKCRNYNPSYLACVNCKLHETEGICFKQELHTEKVYDMMITRPRIDLDEPNK